MAFTQQELGIIQFGKDNNKTREEIIKAIENSRAGIVKKPTMQPEQPSGFLETIKDIPSDIKETVTGVKGAVTTGMETAKEVQQRTLEGETTPIAGTVQTIGAGLRAGARAVGETVLGLGKLFLSPRTEEKVGEFVSEKVTKVVETPTVQKLITTYESLPEETRRTLEGLTGTGEGLTTMFGFAPLLSKFRQVLSGTTRGLLNASDDILTKARNINIPKSPGIKAGQIKKTVGTKIKDIQLKLSDIDPQIETVLKRSTTDDVNRHFVNARNAVVNPAKNTPFEIVGQQAESAFDVISEARKKAIQGKNSILETVATKQVSGNVINDVMSKGIQRLQDKFGIKIDADGTIGQLKGRVSQLDTPDTKLITEYFSRLNALGISPTVKELDDFIDWAQGQLYKQSKSLSTLETASKPAIGQLKGITGDLNSRLKDVVGGGYAEVNARVAHLINLQDEISRALGADARKGGGFVKRLFSPTGGNTREIFEQIRTETGIDLFKEATLAKFAMESLGDVRARSLLKSLDIVVSEVAEFNVTKPIQALKIIREKLDLDGQELANALIKKLTETNISKGQ